VFFSAPFYQQRGTKLKNCNVSNIKLGCSFSFSSHVVDKTKLKKEHLEEKNGASRKILQPCVAQVEAGTSCEVQREYIVGETCATARKEFKHR